MRIDRKFRALWRRPVAGFEAVGYGDVLLAAVASGFAIALVTGTINSADVHGGVGAALAVLLMTVPLAWRRQAPVAAALALGGGAVFNALVFGRLVRCGPCLPTLFIAAFALGHLRRGRLMWLGYLGLAVSGFSQSLSDPNLTASLNVPLLPLIAGFMGAGHLLASRQRVAADLRARNAELRSQREANAALAVAADRARIAEDLDGTLRSRLADMSQVASSAVVSADEEAVRAAFSVIETVGRETLTNMREVVGALRPAAPNAPAPVLAQLDDLLARATTSDTRLTVEGAPQSLPAGVELSGYRIVEHLLVALEDAPDARVDVTVRFTDDALEIAVRGPAARRSDRTAALAAARQRVSIHGGTFAATTSAGRCEAVARLPLVAAHA